MSFPIQLRSSCWHFPEYDCLEVFKTQIDDNSIKVGEQAAGDRGKDTRLVTLKKRIHVVIFVVNNGVDKSTCLTNQEHLQHAWDMIFQHSGYLGYQTKTVLNLSNLLIQVPCSSIPKFFPGSKLPALLDHIFAGYLFLCLLHAQGKT